MIPMATDVKWVKLKVGMFDGESFKKIKRAEIGGAKFRDKLTAVWFELMDFAGKCNHAGAFINSREIPFSSIDEIAIMIDREPEELQLCMQFFINEGMVEIVDNIYQLSNWTQYQNEEGLAKIRENNRIRKANSRAKKAMLAAGANAPEDGKSVTLRDNGVTQDGTGALPSISISNSTSNNSNSSCLEEIEGYGEKEKKPTSVRIDYTAIKTMFNELCPSFPSCVAMSDARKKAIKARFTSGYTIEHFKTLFQKAEASSFLKGRNDKNWMASFDWLIKDSSMAKVLGGNYDDRQPQPVQRAPQPNHGSSGQRNAPPSGVDRLLEAIDRGDFDE